jgi:hypothetical protein
MSFNCLDEHEVIIIFGELLRSIEDQECFEDEICKVVGGILFDQCVLSHGTEVKSSA